MHNSQGGTSVFVGGSGVGWNGSNQLAGTKSATPYKRLLVTSCVGCHSSSTGNTIINVNGSTIPIVYNTGGYPSQPLAGGNFYYVAQGGAANDVYGHNVYGISGIDNNITATEGAPGHGPTPDYGVCGQGCHYSLAEDPANNIFKKNGCQGCHYQDRQHHGARMYDAYRFLWTHMGINNYVQGIESSDWEQNPTQANHNVYKGTADPDDYDWGGSLPGLSEVQTITAFCAGCHQYFHDDMGSSSPWIRHPVDILLPQTGEFSSYNPTTNYNNEVPVAYLDPAVPDRSEAVVMCLSCHRAHGSDQPDMLRWDYSTMEAGTTGAGAGTGCFRCHTEKDGAP